MTNDSSIILDWQSKKCQILYPEWMTEVSKLHREAIFHMIATPLEIMLCISYHYKVFTLNFCFWFGVPIAQKFKQVSLAIDLQVHSWSMIHERLNRCLILPQPLSSNAPLTSSAHQDKGFKELTFYQPLLLDGISEEEQELHLAQRAWSQDSKASNNFSRCL